MESREDGGYCQLGARGVDSVTCIVRGGNERVEKAGARGGFYDSD